MVDRRIYDVRGRRLLPFIWDNALLDDLYERTLKHRKVKDWRVIKETSKYVLWNTGDGLKIQWKKWVKGISVWPDGFRVQK